MNYEEKEIILLELQRFSAHRSLEIAKSNVDHINLLLDCSLKETTIRRLSAQNLLIGCELPYKYNE